jgi:hypothetical protein
VARIRSVKPELRTSLVVGEWPMEVRYFWVLLWGYLDDHGRGVDDPRLVRADCFPLDEGLTSKTVDDWLSMIANAGPLCRYEVDGKRYIHCRNWTEHQRPSHPADSKIPPCSEHEEPPTGKKPNKTKGQVNPLAKSSGDTRENLRPEQGDVLSKGKREQGPPDGGTRARVAPEERDDGDPPSEAEAILKDWISSLPRPPQSRIVNAIGVIVKAAILEHQDPAHVAEALKRWQATGSLGPAALPSVIHEVATRPPRSNVLALPSGRASPFAESTSDQRARQAAEAGRAVQAMLEGRSQCP